MRKKLFATVMAVALVSGLLGVMAPSALAAPPFDTQNFLPDDTPNAGFAGPAGGNGAVLSDRFDGANQTAHLTNVSTADAERVRWYVCADNTGPVVTQAELTSSCTFIGEDTSGRLPSGGNPFAPVDEAYDFEWDIPGSLDNLTRDILAISCIGTGPDAAEDVEGSNMNCAQDIEQDVFLEDGQTGVAANQTTSGEMTLWCHSDVDGGPGSGSGDTCQIGGAGAGTDAQVGARFAAFPHGTNVPNNGFVVRAVTSDDVTTAAWGVDWGADAQTDPNARDQGTNCTLRGTQANFKTWECVVTDLFTNDNAEGAFFIFDNSGGAGYCAAAGEGCLLDVHYIVSSARSVATVTQSFVPGGGGHTHSPPSPAANAGCQPGETAEKTHTVSSLGATEIVEICMVDNFGDPFNGAFTEEVSAPGDVDGGDCTARDHNNDGRFEHCDGGTVGVDGAAQMQVSNFNNTTGTVTITSCFEGEPGVVPPTAQPTDHGCTDEATAHKDTLTLNYGTQPSEVFLAFTDPAPLNPSDPCRTGITFKRNQVGDTDNLIACTYDSNGNPVPTDTNAFRIVWDIQAAQGGEQTAVRFTGSPPQETSGSTATATTSIVAERQGDNFITVRLQDPNANIFENFSIEKQVEGENQPQNVATNLSANKAKRKVRGRAATPRAAECRSGRQVTLFKRVPGPNQVIGQDTTNNFGRYSIGVPKPRPGRYYARVTASTATDSGGQTLNCLADQSDDVRFRRHRR